MKIRLRNVKWAWSRDRSKKIYYHRPTGTRLPDNPASPEFISRLDQLNLQMQREPDAMPAGIAPGSIAALLRDWQSSPEWRALAPRTQALYRGHVERDIPARWLPLPVAALSREAVIGLRDKISGGGKTRKADAVIDTLSSALRYALNRPSQYGGIQINPAYKIPNAHRAGIGHQRWPEALIDKALGLADPELRALLLLLLYTGQRISDVIAMTRSQYDGAGIQIVTQKTRRPLWIPCHPALKATLDAISHNATTLLAVTDRYQARRQHHTLPWKVDHAKHRITDFMRSPAMAAPGYSAHGLRKSACCRLIEAGCDDRDVSETVGMTLEMVRHYTKQVRQQQIAARSVTRLAAADKRRF